jgi:hypothetical protein
MTTQSKTEKPADEQRISITPEKRQQMIAESAYYKAEKRAFLSGAEMKDWLEAEQDLERKIEHRCCERQCVDIAVSLFKGKEPVGKGKLRNFNCHGLFVATDANFDKDTYLRIEFRLPDQAKVYRSWGRVVHGANRGLGFYVDTLESDTRAAVEALSKHAAQ